MLSRAVAREGVDNAAGLQRITSVVVERMRKLLKALGVDAVREQKRMQRAVGIHTRVGHPSEVLAVPNNSGLSNEVVPASCGAVGSKARATVSNETVGAL